MPYLGSIIPSENFYISVSSEILHIDKTAPHLNHLAIEIIFLSSGIISLLKKIFEKIILVWFMLFGLVFVNSNFV